MHRWSLYFLVVVMGLGLSCGKKENSPGATATAVEKTHESEGAQEVNCSEFEAKIEEASQASKKLEDQVASCRKEAAEAQEELGLCGEAKKKLIENEKEALESNQKLSRSQEECSAKVQVLQSKVGQLENEIKAKDEELAHLKATPEMKIIELSKALDTVSSVEEAGVLERALEEFLLAHGKTPQAREAKGLKRKLSARLKKLRKAEAEQKALKAIGDIRDKLAGISDGSLSAVHLVIMGEYLQTNGLDFDAIGQLPQANYKEASKDPASERGKAMVVRGKVIQIQKDGEYFRGLIGTGGYYGMDRLYHFVTPGTTKGVYENKKAKFAGVFTQLYEYQTRGGGFNQAFVLVGYFENQ